MAETSLMHQALVFLLAAVISVPVASRLGLGSVLGYLSAGAVIGPFAFGFIGTDIGDVMHFAEFGVVMMLFLVGSTSASSSWRYSLVARTTPPLKAYCWHYFLYLLVPASTLDCF